MKLEDLKKAPIGSIFLHRNGKIDKNSSFWLKRSELEMICFNLHSVRSSWSMPTMCKNYNDGKDWFIPINEVLEYFIEKDRVRIIEISKELGFPLPEEKVKKDCFICRRTGHE